jgi:hypothetical protein
MGRKGDPEWKGRGGKEKKKNMIRGGRGCCKSSVAGPD